MNSLAKMFLGSNKMILMTFFVLFRRLVRLWRLQGNQAQDLHFKFEFM